MFHKQIRDEQEHTITPCKDFWRALTAKSCYVNGTVKDAVKIRWFYLMWSYFLNKALYSTALC